MTHASLFSGIGGPEIAASMMGWQNIFHCEINPFGRSVLEYHFPESDSYEDITRTDFTRYKGKIDVLTGGFPCQPFSYAGKRGGQNDNRYLWPQMLRVINEVRPTWVIGENVAGITTMVEGSNVVRMECQTTLFEKDNRVYGFRSEQPFTIERICRDLESNGYSVQPMLIPACGVGAPHRRDRVFIIAYNTHSCDDLRKSGKDDGQSREEWLQERNKVRFIGKPTSIRPSIQTSSSKGLEPENKWKGFPNVSTFYRGNDGIPFDVDSLTIPFSKWRNESLKAYGNAIVPQVMYRIFQAIESNGNKR